MPTFWIEQTVPDCLDCGREAWETMRAQGGGVLLQGERTYWSENGTDMLEYVCLECWGQRRAKEGGADGRSAEPAEGPGG